jgi:hypothetical protein
MSEDEKAQQIDRLIQERQEAKNDLSHLTVKIGIISRVYSEVGKTLSYMRFEAIPFTFENGHFSISSSAVNREISDNLLNEKQLVAVLNDYNEARERVSWIESQLATLQMGQLK